MSLLASTPLSGWRRYRAAVLVASSTTFLVFLWLFTTVHCNYHGDWTALYCAGDKLPQPPFIRQTPYRFEQSTGYDGQYFRFIVRDLLGVHNSASYIRAPTLRYRRILLPALGALVTFGRDDLVDYGMIAVQLAFVFLGVFCSARLCELFQRNVWFGAGYALVPATVISLDRQLADGPLLALTAAFFWLLREEEVTGRARPVLLWLVLTAGILSRETGVILVGGYCISLLVRKQIGRCFRYATAAVPLALWAVYVERMSVAYTQVTSRGAVYNFALGDHGWLDSFGLVRPVPGIAPALATSVQALTCLSLAMVPVFMVWAVVRLWQRRDGAAEWSAVLLTLILIPLATNNYLDPFGYPRLMSPLMLYAAVDVVRTGRWWLLLPQLPVIGRVLAQLTPQYLGILHRIAG